ncbi:uncharacterized protein HGUI_02123 [Hanseniaspora guilliermondii]|uniref:Uncharacterized protein n=1 Tax=Hanseniaspora guilliermondii TaxID=56406 RepID=A0A1L0B4I1_9ASCO|nr:uncharacterized protein HGUI_02123 [Hanseniaspora guilliermondii]
MMSLIRLNRVFSSNIKITRYLTSHKLVNFSSRRFNSTNGIPWFVQKYEEQDNSTNPFTLDGALKNLEDRENLTIKYSDETIVEKDPPENIEDIEKINELNNHVLNDFQNLKIIANFKDLTIINSPLRTNKDFFILLNSMDSKQHNDKILATLKTHFKKVKGDNIRVEKIRITGFRQDYLSKRKRTRMEKKLKVNNGFINTRYFKKNKDENLYNEQINSLFNKGTDKSWGMMTFELVHKNERFSFEIHVLSPLQRALINFEDLYQIEEIHPSMKDMLMLLETEDEFYKENSTKLASLNEEQEGSIFDELDETNHTKG